MKNIFLVILILFFCAVSAFPDSYEEVAGSGLLIKSDPSGAKVFIDGVERGTTPYRNTSLRVGEYNIRVTREGYKERRFTAVIRSGSRIEISVDLEVIKGQVILGFSRDPAASPSLDFNPRIFVDGSDLPGSEIITSSVYEYRINLTEGWRNISVDAFGWDRVNERVYIQEGSIQRIELFFSPAQFTLSNVSLRNKRFNPRNPGVLGNAEISFTVSAPGRGVLEVSDLKGELIYTYSFVPFYDWQQKVVWNGRNSAGSPAEDGTYILTISVWDDETEKTQSAEIAVNVDSSMVIRPLTATSASAGLMFVAFPEALPPFSFQVDAAVLAGKLLYREKAFKSPGVALGLRVSFPENTELNAAFGLVPELPENAKWDAGVSVKWVFFQSENNTAAVAAELTYGFSASGGPYTVFGMGTGIGLRFPAMYRLVSGTTSKNSCYFDLLLSPLFLWAGGEGRPDSLVPRLGAEGGIFFSHGGFAAGLSCRWDYAPDAEGEGPLVSALEIKFFPSNFVVTVSGAYWYSVQEGNSGAFFGFGFGIMY